MLVRKNMVSIDEQQRLVNDDEQTYYTIEQVATRTGLTKRTLRYYEEVGLLPPTGRTEGNYRRYSESDVQRLERIKELRDLLGFSLNDIRELLHVEEERGQIRMAYRYETEATGKIAQLDRADELIREQLHLIEQRLLGGKRSRGGFAVTRPALLTPAGSDATWLAWARKISGTMLFEPESLYRGVLFAAALATLSLTNGSRVMELLQVSASRFETIVVDELKNQQPTGRKIGILVQKLLPKGYRHDSERQFFLISDMAVRLLKEIAELLQATHGGSIPVVHPNPYMTKAEDLWPEPYFFQWATSDEGRLGHLSTADVSHLLRFLFHGLTLTTRTGEPIRVAPPLLRHVLATHARTVQKIPAEAVAYLLHHRVTLPDSSYALTISEATAYYSRLPVSHLLALLFEVQSMIVSGQGRSYLQAPSPQTLEQMDEVLRKKFEQVGMIGPTVLGFCSAGVCVRPDNRGICANCPHLVPHYSNLRHAKIWRKLYELQAKMHDDQGHAVDAEQARKMVQYFDDTIRIMEIQIQTRQDGGYLPFADALLSTQEDEGAEQ